MAHVRRSAILILLLAGCAAPRNTQLAELLKKLGSKERVDAFQQLLSAPADLTRALKSFAALAPEHGCPVAAVLYRMGEGDSVPLDIKARHFALFEWPSKYREENVILEAIITRRLRHDLIRAGRAAVPHLAVAFDDSPRAKDVAELMLFLDERAAAAEFAKRLDHPAARRALTQIAGTDALEDWWERNKDRPHDDWVRSRCRALLESDLDAFNRETGGRFADRDAASTWWNHSQGLPPVECTNTQLQDERGSLENRLTAEIAAAQQEVRKLESERVTVMTQNSTIQSELDQLRQKERANTAAVASTQANNEKRTEQVEILREQIREHQQSRDEAFATVIKATDDLHEAQGKVSSLLERNRQLVADGSP